MYANFSNPVVVLDGSGARGQAFKCIKCLETYTRWQDTGDSSSTSTLSAHLKTRLMPAELAIARSAVSMHQQYSLKPLTDAQFW